MNQEYEQRIIYAMFKKRFGDKYIFYDMGLSLDNKDWLISVFGPKIVKYRKKGNKDATCVYSKYGRSYYILGYRRKTNKFFFMDEKTGKNLMIPYKNKGEALKFGKYFKRLYGEEYSSDIAKGITTSTKKRGMQKKRQYNTVLPKLTKEEKKKRKKLDQFNQRDIIFLYWLYGEDIFKLREANLRRALLTNIFDDTKVALTKKNAEVSNLVYACSLEDPEEVFHDMSCDKQGLWASKTMQKRIVTTQQHKIKKAKEFLEGRRYTVPPKEELEEAKKILSGDRGESLD